MGGFLLLFFQFKIDLNNIFYIQKCGLFKNNLKKSTKQ